MNEELRNILEKFETFSQEHEPVLIGTAAILFILLVVLIGRKIRKNSGEKKAEQEAQEKTICPEEAQVLSVENASDFVSEEEPVSEEKKEEKETEQTKKKELPKSGQREIDLQVEPKKVLRDLTEMSHLHKDSLESIEIKIEKAQVTIRYAANGKNPQPAPETKQAGWKGEGAEAEMKSEKEEKQEFFPKPETEKDEKERRPEILKFGAENKNVSRSGKAYTADEIDSIIKD